MKCIAVGVDGSDASRTALVWAAKLAGCVGAEIIAINAWHRRFAEASPETHDRLLAERRSVVEAEWIRPATELGAKVRSIVCEGDARQVLLPTVESEAADLVVLGRTGAGGGPGFLHLGSAVEYAAHHTSAPLAVIPGDSSGALERIVVGVDGSRESLRALGWVTEMAPSMESSVVVVQVEEPFVEWTPVSSSHNWRRDVERHLEEWTAPLAAEDVPVELVAQRDLRPADGLLGVAKARRADLLVIGARGTGGFTGLRAGGVTLGVLHRAHLPVVMIPPDASNR